MKPQCLKSNLSPASTPHNPLYRHHKLTLSMAYPSLVSFRSPVRAPARFSASFLASPVLSSSGNVSHPLERYSADTTVGSPLAARKSHQMLSLVLAAYGPQSPSKPAVPPASKHKYGPLALSATFHKRIKSDYNNGPNSAATAHHNKPAGSTSTTKNPSWFPQKSLPHMNNYNIHAKSTVKVLSPRLPQVPAKKIARNMHKATYSTIPAPKPQPVELVRRQTIMVRPSQPPIEFLRRNTVSSTIRAEPALLAKARNPEREKVVAHISKCFHEIGSAPQTSIWFYKIGRTLGKGAFGKVCLGVHKLSGRMVAVKAISKKVMESEASRSKVLREVAIWGQLAHPNIIRLLETFESEKHLLYIEELCAGGDLLTYVRKRRRLTENVAKCVLHQILDALQYCHLKGILHRDIKLDNVLLDSAGTVKVCDFGVSKAVFAGERLVEQCGTPAYIAPEMLTGAGYEGFAGDVWSAGIVLYAMLYGTVPFKGKSVEELTNFIIHGDFEARDDVSAEARDLLRKMLEKDPTRRVTISAVLVHPWFAGYDPSTAKLFTREESAKIAEEFNCSRLGQDRDETSLEEDDFVEQSIESSQSDLSRNASTKSVVFAPFNTMERKAEELESAGTAVFERKEHVLRLGSKVRDIDAQYERNNNCEIDNGVYNNKIAGEEAPPLPEHEKEEEESKASPQTSSSERQTSYTRPEIGMRAAKRTAECGYPIGYVTECLANAVRNYATTTYYLLSNYPE